jgi:hypothetical protein
MNEDAFPYETWDGQARFKDGQAAWIAIVRTLHGKPNDYIEKYNHPEPVMKADGAEGLILATRKAFNLPDFNGMTGEGASDAYALRLFGEFNTWLAKKKVTAALPPTSLPPSGSLPTPASTGLLSDCG